MAIQVTAQSADSPPIKPTPVKTTPIKATPPRRVPVKPQRA